MEISRRSVLAAGAGLFAFMSNDEILQAQSLKKKDSETIRVGIVGCGPYSHCVSYGNVILGLGERRPLKTHMHITHVWGDDYRKNYAGKIWTSGKARSMLAARSPEYFEKNSDARIVQHPEDMIGGIDAAMIMDFDRSAELAEPFLREGIPVFVNRPYAATMSDGLKILDSAKKTGTAVFTGSLVPWLFETRKTKGAVERDKLFAFHADGLTASYSRYVSHALEYVYAIVGYGVHRVRLSGWNGSEGYDPSVLPPILIELEYESRGGDDPPLRGTLLMREHFPHDWWFKGYHRGGKIVEGAVPDNSGISRDVGDDHWRVPFLSIMDNVFRTNSSPETRKDILHKLATLLAAHKSAMEDGRWVGLDEVENHRLPSVITEHWAEKI